MHVYVQNISRMIQKKLIIVVASGKRTQEMRVRLMFVFLLFCVCFKFFSVYFFF